MSFIYLSNKISSATFIYSWTIWTPCILPFEAFCVATTLPYIVVDKSFIKSMTRNLICEREKYINLEYFSIKADSQTCLIWPFKATLK